MLLARYLKSNENTNRRKFAKLTPYTVNGIQAGFYDPWANDQDWGLNFMFDYMD
ncbi:hypothetical protein [Metabacillus malikii]|uniref:Uncharacterized protein n=1 Tax=Metabacillus malikii TaxID=1504265 RepID=A0ABT9ZA92_9BACI|nr:hypothetical protein [Metabacillus malikii]MDQ0229156.1 hypothetical protein [Metabacillus malikii]